MDKLIIVFGGAFNPVTTAHLSLAEQLTNQYSVEKVLFMPVSDLYNKKDLIKACHRINMLQQICDKNDKFDVCTIEVDSNILLNSIDSLSLIKSKYPNNTIAFLMGSDNLRQIHTWKDFDRLMGDFIFIVITRNGDDTIDIVQQSELLRPYKDRFIHCRETIRNDGNSSYIRELRKAGKSIRYLVPDEVYYYTIKNELYIS